MRQDDSGRAGCRANISKYATQDSDDVAFNNVVFPHPVDDV